MASEWEAADPIVRTVTVSRGALSVELTAVAFQAFLRQSWLLAIKASQRTGAEKVNRAAHKLLASKLIKLAADLDLLRKIPEYVEPLDFGDSVVEPPAMGGDGAV